MQKPTSPINPTDDAARHTARALIAGARTAALAVLQPDTGAPHVSLIAISPDPGGCVLTLVSSLALHARALAADPRASLLLVEPGPKGDPRTHPRLSLNVTAIPAAATDRAELRDLWLSRHPKAKLYIDFADFHFLRLLPSSALLNAGFGRAYLLTPADLEP